jgi:GT2 family glycosyltransferase/glycosyltransferase involved in cell wall biosynthesis
MTIADQTGELPLGETVPKASFAPSGVQLRRVGKSVVVGLALDGCPIDATSVASGEGLFLPLPPIARDGLEHTVEVSLAGPVGEVMLRGSVKSHYVGYIEPLQDGQSVQSGVGGWMLDVAEPDRILDLDVELDGILVANCRTGGSRPDVKDAGYLTANAGFNSTFPRPGSLVAPTILTIRISGTRTAPLGSYLVNVSVASYAVLSNPGVGRAEELFRDRVALPALLQSARAPDAEAARPVKGLIRLTESEFRAPGRPHVDVVIPAYRGLEETLACISSALAGKGAVECTVVVVNDRSPEPELATKLREMASEGLILLIENSANLGFVASVNRGMRRDPRRDVVLLNSDTLVPPNWLDRLFAAAHADERIATVTALSNNATICSLPRIGGVDGLPYGKTLQAIDSVCAAVNQGIVVDLPTAHGFCMFIKRAALDDVGLFDEATFGRGYGEENDFSLRAAARGWRNVAACDVFVEHKGSVSFQGSAAELTQRNLRILAASYPDYHFQVMQFIRDDPMHAARNRVQIAFWKPRQCVILVSLAIGGGVGRHVDDVAEGLAAEGLLPLILTRSGEGMHVGYRLRAWRSEDELLYPPGPLALAEAVSDFLQLRPRYVHVHHLLDIEAGFAELLIGSGLPYQVTLHDFFFVCPRITLLDESANHCGLPGSDKCNRCVARAGVHPAMHDTHRKSAVDVAGWRASWGRLLTRADRVVAPSASTADLHAGVFPNLAIAIHPHETVTQAAPPWASRPSQDRIEVVLLGAIGPHKGLGRLLDLLRYAERWADDLRFTIVGFTSDDEALKGYGNARLGGSYAQGELPGRLRQQAAQVALFLSPWPETYSYTLSEALQAGLTPVAFDIGAFGERLRALGCGVLVEPDCRPERLVHAIRTAAAQRVLPVAIKPAMLPALPLAMPDGSASALPQASTLLLRPPEHCFGDGWVGQKLEWLFHLRHPATALQLEIWIPRQMAGQFVTVSIGGARMVRRQLTPDGVTRISLHPEVRAGLLSVRCVFDFEVPLGAVDRRSCSAVLRSLILESQAERVVWTPSEAYN